MKYKFLYDWWLGDDVNMIDFISSFRYGWWCGRFYSAGRVIPDGEEFSMEEFEDVRGIDWFDDLCRYHDKGYQDAARITDYASKMAHERAADRALLSGVEDATEDMIRDMPLEGQLALFSAIISFTPRSNADLKMIIDVTNKINFSQRKGICVDYKNYIDDGKYVPDLHHNDDAFIKEYFDIGYHF